MNKREEIIDAAFMLLRESGDASLLNLRKIARRAGCAHTNAYNYFPNFESLKWAMLEESLRRLETQMFTGTGKDSLVVISEYIDFAIENPAEYKLIWATDLQEDAAPEDRTFLYRIPARLAGMFPEDTADLLHSYVHGKLMNMIFRRLPVEEPALLKKEILAVCCKFM